MEKTISQKNYKPYLCIWGFLAVFAAMFTLNFILPIKNIILINHFGDITGRATNWCYLLLCILASYYILKIRKFKLLDLIVGIVLGYIGWYVGYNGYISSITVFACYYSACQIFRKYKQENKYFDIGIRIFLKSLLFGIVLAIPFAIINDVAMNIMSGSGFKSFSFGSIIPSALHAVPPGATEEIIFRFFLIAFATYVFGSNIPKDKFTVFSVYILCIVPHNLIHYPAVFLNSPIMGIAVALFTALLFGIPMTWLVRNKNLQTSMAFHWFIDFVRFIF